MRPTFELAPVFARLGGRFGALSSSTRALRLVGGRGGAAIEFLVLARGGVLRGESVVRRVGGKIDTGEALFVRLGAGGGGAGDDDDDDGGGCELLWPRSMLGLGAGLGGAGLRRVCFMKWGAEDPEGPKSTTESSSSRSDTGADGAVLRRRA